MTRLFSRKLSFVMGAALTAGLLAGCDSGGTGDKLVPVLPDYPGSEESDPYTEPDPIPDEQPQSCNAMPDCNSALHVSASGPAMLVTDPEVLAELPLEKVVKQILDFEGVEWTPEEMMQRLFDTMNSESGAQFGDVIHCDSDFNTATKFGGDSFLCPRAEGILAASDSFFKDGDPDSFIPVAVVNRFDLTPIDGSKCGQYRIIYAKRSGLTDPHDRVFLIFEAALANPVPGCLESCRPVAEFWHGLEGRTKADIATHLRTFFFAGIPGFKPAVHPLHYGLGSTDEGYGAAEGGQIRVSAHMGESSEWTMREMKLMNHPQNGTPMFLPVTVKNNPPAHFFDPQAEDSSGMAESLRQSFLWNDLLPLSSKSLTGVQMFTFPEFNGVESVLSGEKKNDYFAAATSGGDTAYLDLIQQQITDQNLNLDCPENDPFDAEAALRRATTLSCAGCHAPQDFLGESRSIGCGLTWPATMGQTHINEKGQISPALAEVFLPHRAEVMQTFLQACDPNAIAGSLQQPPKGGGFEKQAHPGEGSARTLGGSQSH